VNFTEYQSHAARTANPKLNPRERVVQACFGLAGESGEVIDGQKKILYHDHDFDRDELVEELGDVCWYIAEMCSVWGISLDEVAECNVKKLMARYPVAFDEERSRNRVEDSTKALLLQAGSR
jgi:NTP pyrophosphatase (non-canonical NTP hydrolase)